MNKLFNDLCKGLSFQGYQELGGSDVFRMFKKDGCGIKLFIDNYEEPNHIIVRYYFK